MMKRVLLLACLHATAATAQPYAMPDRLHPFQSRTGTFRDRLGLGPDTAQNSAADTAEGRPRKNGIVAPSKKQPTPVAR